MMLKHTAGNLKKLFLLKAKYAAASATATSVDYLLYYTLFHFFGLPKTVSNFISYPVGVLLNFMFQKRFIFTMERGLKTTFGLAMLVSAGGWALNATFFFLLMKSPFFQTGGWHWAAKIIVNGLVFFYNFYGKRYVFEKRFL